MSAKKVKLLISDKRGKGMRITGDTPFIVIKVFNTLDYRVGQFLTIAEVRDAIERGIETELK